MPLIDRLAHTFRHESYPYRLSAVISVATTTALRIEPAP